MRKIIPAYLLAVFCSVSAVADEWDGLPASLDSNLADLPSVLTATRLKQPRAEVPGSMTVITAEQIAAWGVRTIPEVLRFVPGMVIGHSHYENNTQVSYHISNPNLMRRMQVLVDGRSVYKNSIANVVWDDIPVALEDIDRIEVMRGPNSATYGANAFMSTINIITKEPTDTLGTRIRYRTGTHGTNDTFISYSGLTDTSSYRLSANMQQHDGFDSEYAVKNGGWTDSKEHGFISGVYQRELTPTTQLELQGSYKKGTSEVKNDFMPEAESISSVLYSKVTFDFSEKHKSHLQVYFTEEKSNQQGRIVGNKLFINQYLYSAYQNDSSGVKRIMDDISSSKKPDGTSKTDSDRKADQFKLVKLLHDDYYSHLGKSLLDVVNILEGENDLKLSGYSDFDISEMRLDAEWQDTIIWNESLRSVTGVNVRQDWVESKHYFNGSNRNTLYRVFGNMEWRMTDSLLWNVGAMYEAEDKNDSAFSPRFALNWLLTDRQSIRFVTSKAVRSPDLLEQEADHGIILRDVRDDSGALLRDENGDLLPDEVRAYEHRIAKGDLDHERITSYEIGYYGFFPSTGLSIDIKLYRDYLTNLISAPVNFSTTDITSDVEIDVSGIDLQVLWQWDHNDWLWFAWAYNDNKVDPGSYHLYSSRDPIEVIVEGERRASAKNTYVASWHHSGNSWGSTLSYFFYDQYNNNVTDYQRLELNLRKDFVVGKAKPWIGFWWQHIMGNGHDGGTPYLSREYHRYESRNLYFFQAGLNF